ncbi:hypothetical protein [Alloactinosynnema sp. L-07]|uniref:hypothetical protein n=1 Tax=Alloactinosynnema sp. L-07 TaxID=1653480 RepID=UPI00065EFC3B|nr:hypothetical protein [Alloactinosynnema sp. L-07]CRK59192.1 hypothetical protein [Alloactinosynnema sp. L-07]
MNPDEMIERLERRLDEHSASAQLSRRSTDAIGFDPVAVADEIDKDVAHTRWIIQLYREGKITVERVEGYARTYRVMPDPVD